MLSWSEEPRPCQQSHAPPVGNSYQPMPCFAGTAARASSRQRLPLKPTPGRSRAVPRLSLARPGPGSRSQRFRPRPLSRAVGPRRRDWAIRRGATRHRSPSGQGHKAGRGFHLSRAGRACHHRRWPRRRRGLGCRLSRACRSQDSQGRSSQVGLEDQCRLRERCPRRNGASA